MHVAGLNIYTPPNGAGHHFIPQMLARWSQHLAAQAPFNLRPVLRLGLWHWEEDPQFELDYHLRHVALPQPGRIRELLAMVSRLHGNLLDRNRPLWEMYVIEGLPGGRFATYTKIHHALMDGVTGAKTMARGLAQSADDIKPPLWAQAKPHKPKAQAASKATGLRQHLDHLAQAAREILPGIGSGLWDLVRSDSGEQTPALPFSAPPTPFNVEITGSRRFAAQSYALSRLRHIGTAAGATVNDVTLAICSGAIRRHLEAAGTLPRKPLIAMVPVSLHSDADASGNQVSLLLANLATHIADPQKRLKKIVQSTTSAKERLSSMARLQKMAHGITSISPMGAAMVTGSAKKHPLFNVVISNVPGPKQALFMDGARLDEVYPVSIPSQYLALNITISGYGDNLGFGFIACRRSVPALQRMLAYTDDAINELEHAFGIVTTRPLAQVEQGAKAGRTKADKTPASPSPARKNTPSRRTA